MGISAGIHIKGYELRERIGAGGFGAVFRAYQSTVGREVAVKVILASLTNQPEFIRRFEGEAQLVARLEHPHITPLYDYWRDPDGTYLVMRLLRGGSLRDALVNGPYDLRTAAQLLDQVAGALSLAHRNNVIHRDIKPGNILLDEDGNAYLTDFGIAKDLNLPGSNTQPDAIVGSLDYISPEQARSEPITPRTDIYSLGVTLYEVITGSHPFANLSPVERLYKHINDPLPEITTLDEELRENINQVIQKATAKNPEHRYPDALAFAAEFREAVGMNRLSTTVVELLTQREHEILYLIVEGLSNKEIAQRLTVTLSTVKWYVNQIYTKLGVRSRVQAMVRARELNLLVQPGQAVEIRVVPTEDFFPENPYKGLQAFQAADHQDFFGREKVTARLVKRLEEAHEFGRFLAIIGPSGSGKSSLVKAGLIPALWRGKIPGSEKWFVVEMLPGEHPLDELEVALTRIAAHPVSALKEHLARDARGLIRASQLILPANGELVLVIDQFEELFTLVEQDDVRAHFLNLLYSAVMEARSRVRVVITLRADFYDRPLHYPEFGELLRSRMETVLPLSAQELERAISKPAERVGVRFEEGLVASIVAEVNYQAGALPLLQYALTELFEQRAGRLLTREGYTATGGAVGALARRADDIYQQMDETSQEMTRQMFLRLVTLGEGTEDTRRRVKRSELRALAPDPDMMDEIIDTYAGYRLLALDHDPGSRSPTVEVAHEAILRIWEQLSLWLSESRDDIKLQRQVAELAAEWWNASQDKSFLVRGGRLNQLEQWTQETKLALTPTEWAYLDASIQQRAEEARIETERQARVKALEQRSVRFLRVLVAVMFMALIGAGALTVFATGESRKAQENAAEAQQVALIAGSQAAKVDDNTDTAIALAMEAVNRNPTSAQAQTALSQAAYAPGTVRVFTGHTDHVHGVDISPDGLTALSASWDDSVILWDIQTADILRRFEAPAGDAMAVAYLPDGQHAIAGYASGALIEWNLTTGEIVRRFEGATDEIWTLDVSPSGRTVAAAGAAPTVWVWNTSTGELTETLEGHTASIERVVFGHTDNLLFSGSQDYSMIRWNLSTGTIAQRFEGHVARITGIALNADDTRAATSSLDGSLILWDTNTGAKIDQFWEQRDIWDLIFSQDGQSLISAGIGGALQYWDIAVALSPGSPSGHLGTIRDITLHPDGRHAMTAADDNTLRLWDLESGQVIYRSPQQGIYPSAWAVSDDLSLVLTAWFREDGTSLVLTDGATDREIQRTEALDSVSGAAFSPDNTMLLLATYSNETEAYVLVLWDVERWQPIRQFEPNPQDYFFGASIAFSPDGRFAATSDGKRGDPVVVWDVASGKPILQLPGEESNWWSTVIFSRDGQTIYATDTDGTIARWNAQTGEPLPRMIGHTSFAWNIVLSADGHLGYTGSEDLTSILWDMDSGTVLRRFSNILPVAGVAITRDGRYGLEGIMGQLRDLDSGEVIRKYDGLSLVSWFALDSRTAIVIGPSTGTELWRIDLTLDDLIAWVHANRYIPELTCEQRDLYRLEPLCSTTDSK
ncbi:MAG: protein kinase [Anaerolineaceae bacterium]|nr:protein kinase [Anaerolineaceae bacterium]